MLALLGLPRSCNGHSINLCWGRATPVEVAYAPSEADRSNPMGGEVWRAQGTKSLVFLPSPSPPPLSLSPCSCCNITACLRSSKPLCPVARKPSHQRSVCSVLHPEQLVRWPLVTPHDFSVEMKKKRHYSEQGAKVWEGGLWGILCSLVVCNCSAS